MLPNLSPLKNQIILGNALEGLRNIPTESIDAVITDPPYGIAKAQPLKSSSHGAFKSLDSNWDIFKTVEDFRLFSQEWIGECHRILKPNGSIAVWGSRQSIFVIQPLLAQVFPKYLDMITWVKRDSPPNMTQRGMAPSTEFCLWFCKSESNWTYNSKELKKYNNGKQLRNYWDIQRSMGKLEKASHPTQKKIETQLILVDMLTHKGQAIVDPFMGSGTLAVAAKMLDRDFIGFEQSQEYYHIALERLDKVIKL